MHDVVLRAVDRGGPVGVEFDPPAVPVHADIMVELAQEHAVRYR
jgi:hypothetical protein